MLRGASRDEFVALGRLGAAHQCDAESVPTARALGRYLSEGLSLPTATLPRAHRLTPADLGRIAAAGRAQVPCVRRPTVAVFTAGHGLRPPGQALGINERFDGARAFLMGRLLESGIEPVAWPILPEELERATPMLEDAAQAFDLVLVCSPTSIDGTPVLASAVDAQAPSAIVRIDEHRGQGDFVAVAAAFGMRQPRALMLCLPDALDGLSEHWDDTAGRLIAAMQGVSESSGSITQDEADSQNEDIDVREAARLQTLGATVIDVREAEEVALGHATGAIMLPLSALESGAILPPELPRPLLMICAIGSRSQRAAALLKAGGIAAARSIRGGTAAWAQAGLPMSQPAGSVSDFSTDELARYDRHLRLANVGPDGQRRLRDARVLIVGAGGLGSPAAFYLAAAGVGTLVLVDDDRVDRSNLQRQILHVDASVGTSKVQSARERLLALNPSIVVEAIATRVDSQNVEALLAGADVVIDGSDNFAARYLLNAACVQRGVPLVYGAVERFTGQASVFDAGRRRGEAPCYRCLFPEPPGADAAPNCAEAGVLGVLPGLIGLIQATETLKLLLGLGEPLIGRVLTVDALAMKFRPLTLKADPDCPECGIAAGFSGYEAIAAFCAAR